MTQYLDLEAARAVVDGAREIAAELGDPALAPPPLDECRLEIIESALAAPQEGSIDEAFYPELADKVTVLAYRIIKGHACIDGNKRLALLLASAFLEINGHDLDASAEEIDHVFRHVAESDPGGYDKTLTMLAHWFEQATRPLDEEE